jgi:hypothetical protein
MYPEVKRYKGKEMGTFLALKRGKRRVSREIPRENKKRTKY